jgi:cytochrome c-type biogenesis protein CcmH/NrfF
VTSWRRLALAGLAGYLCLAQISSQYLTPDVKRVGARLACLCGSCKNSVGDCAMLGCHYSAPARERIHQMLQDGMSDDAIVAVFVKEQGIRALIVPPAEGFNLLAWWGPVLMILAGLGMIYAWIRRMRRPAAVVVAAGGDQTLERYQDSIEKDLAKLEE